MENYEHENYDHGTVIVLALLSTVLIPINKIVFWMVKRMSKYTHLFQVNKRYFKGAPNA